jgi:serine/threonine protein phosphatase PrpC
MNIIIQTYSATGIRPSNEDTLDIINNLSGNNKNLANILYTGVFDGHGGGEISKSLVSPDKINISKYLCSLTSPIISKITNSNNNCNKYLTSVFERIQQKLINYHPSANTMGSTALISLIYKNDSKNKYCLKVINLGDSRCILCNKYNIGNALTLDHKPHFINEKKRILNSGGHIEYSDEDDPRINGMSVSRSFGDLDNPFISQKPDIFNYILNNDKFLLLACDGVWDVLATQDVTNYILEQYDNLISSNKPLIERKGKTDNNIAYKLADYAINNKKSKDNISVIIIFFIDNM